MFAKMLTAFYFSLCAAEQLNSYINKQWAQIFWKQIQRFSLVNISSFSLYFFPLSPCQVLSTAPQDDAGDFKIIKSFCFCMTSIDTTSA